MSTLEPSIELLGHRWQRYLLATRPPFLLAAACPALLGLAFTVWSGHAIDWPAAVAALLAIVCLHAGVNLLNDYFDALNGTDALNEERLYPFTGGSRFIQNGVLGLRETLLLGIGLWLVTAVLGIWLAGISGPALYLLGALGLFIGWAYSAPPLRLNSRGLGELSVALGFGLIPVGMHYTQTTDFDLRLFAAALPAGLLTANLLIINQFPDRRADEQAGKHHWVVRLGPRRARWMYAAVGALAYALLVLWVAIDILPATTLLGLLAVAPSTVAALHLIRHWDRPALLAPAIKLTILALLGHTLLLALGLLVV
ncbi:MAG: 1,4-dihydroxy-2-naphthoate octaprenyltransferase [Chromatiales bacterium]|jgi:1,4-dihydroxy-2-naphthoate octaprenyltransferase|nr:1,4-dihydroxy-2-naphthoate octaprenyltransferase [Chromatiales bacterium]MDX9766848.1 1,4-dihydroxy-2-naphthoate octaprenyltransferase [Ectothiorhodospiraceae bacterium]